MASPSLSIVCSADPEKTRVSSRKQTTGQTIPALAPLRFAHFLAAPLFVFCWGLFFLLDPFLFGFFLLSSFLFFRVAHLTSRRIKPSNADPSSPSIALTAASCHRKVTKAKPRLCPVSLSTGMCTLFTWPYSCITRRSCASLVHLETFKKIFLGYLAAVDVEDEPVEVAAVEATE